jgi:sugar O-acyltransferase (sialic acid O-acetyltransferase NeuD family)
MTELVGVYGAGGSGRGLLPLIRKELANDDVHLVFIDDGAATARINGHEVLSWDGFLTQSASARSICIAIANSAVREALADRCARAGVAVRGARADTVVEMDDVQIGEGACLSPFVTLTSNIRIGRCFHANLYSYVEHDCIIGDFVTFAPGVKCNGHVRIEDHVYVGAGAMIRQGVAGRPLVIGRGATIGMGAVVTKDVSPGTTIVGNPGRPLVKG